MKRVVLSVLVCCFLLSGVVQAQNRPMANQRNLQNRKPKPVSSILDESQKKEWQKIKIDFQKQKNELKAKLQNANLDLRQLMSDQRVPDEGAVFTKLNEISGYKNELAKLNTEQQLQFRKLLSDDQWQQFQDLKRRQAAVKRREQLRLRRLRQRQIQKMKG